MGGAALTVSLLRLFFRHIRERTSPTFGCAACMRRSSAPSVACGIPAECEPARDRWLAIARCASCRRELTKRPDPGRRRAYTAGCGASWTPQWRPCAGRRGRTQVLHARASATSCARRARERDRGRQTEKSDLTAERYRAELSPLPRWSVAGVCRARSMMGFTAIRLEPALERADRRGAGNDRRATARPTRHGFR